MARTQPQTKAATAEAEDQVQAAGGGLATVAASTAIAAQKPQWMSDAEGDGSMDLVKTYVRPPRIKVVQGQAKAPFNELFKPGDLCAVPMMKPIFEGWKDKEENVAFHFVPILFYPEWVAWNPYGTDLPAIRVDENGNQMRTLNPKSDLAIRSRDPARRREPCKERPTLPDGRPAFVSYLEHLNFVIMILPPNELAELPIIMPFASGEHRSGTNFATLLQQRRVKHLYGCQFVAKVNRRTNKQGTWFGIDVDNPAADSGVAPFIQDEAMFKQLAAIHAEYRSYVDEQRLVVDLDDEGTLDGTAAAGGAPPKDEKQF